MADIPILYDADVDRLADMGELVRVMQDSLRANAAGRLVAPARHQVGFGPGDMVFTIGGLKPGEAGAGGLAGFRAYGRFKGAGKGPDLTAVWDIATGEITGLFLGTRLGALRTGALGGAAIAALARPGAETLGVVGAGAQARAQILAAAAVRPLQRVRVFSRRPEPRAALAGEMRHRLGLIVEDVESAEAAVADADIVCLATSSRQPVIETRWLKPGAHVNALGLKLSGAHELPLDLPQQAAVIATDSIPQTQELADHFLRETPAWDRVTDLAQVIAGAATGRGSKDQLTLFLSMGLAGTEVTAGAHLLARLTNG